MYYFGTPYLSILFINFNKICSTWYLYSLLQATDSNADHILDVFVYARLSEKCKILLLFFLRKMHNFQIVITVSNTLISVTNGFQACIDRFEMCSVYALHVFDC